MKRHTLATVFVCVLAACSSKAQKDDQAPVEGPAFRLQGEIPALKELALVDDAPNAEPTGEIGETRAFRIGDLRVIHKRTTSNSVVQARVYVYGGSANLTEKTSGIEELAMNVAVSGGTEATPKDEYNGQLDATGAAIFSFTDRDYSGYGLKTLTDHFGQNWELFTQAILAPAMPPDEVELRRAKQLARIASLLDSPDSQMNYTIGQYMYGGHPYANLHIGTKENVEGFTRDQLLAYQRAMLVPANLLVVVVGNVDTQELVERVRSSFGRLAQKPVAEIAAPAFSSQAGLRIETRKLPTHYIIGMFEAPAPGHPDFAALNIALDYLRERLFEEVRTKRNLTYAVSSGLGERRSNVGYLYVTAEKPDITLPVMFDEVRKLKESKISSETLKQTLNVFITHHYMGLQTNGSQAATIADAELKIGDWKRADALLGEIRAVTPEDIQRVAQTYLKDYRFVVVGPSDALDPNLFQGTAAPADAN